MQREIIKKNESINWLPPRRISVEKKIIFTAGLSSLFSYLLHYMYVICVSWRAKSNKKESE